MKNSDKWMGNVLDSRFKFALQASNAMVYMHYFTPATAIMLKSSVLRVQQVRSYNMNLIQKSDMWETKNWFRSQVSRIIEENNFKCKSLVELEYLVLVSVKNFLAQELPKPGFVDGPWKIFTERLIELENAEAISEDAFQHIKTEILKVANVELTTEQIQSLMGVKVAGTTTSSIVVADVQNAETVFPA